MARPNASYFTPGPRLLRWISKTHLSLYEATHGLLGAVIAQRGEEGHGALRPMQVLLLGTTGRKSGLPRRTPLPYFQYDDRLFVIASNGASDKHPDWYENLLATPEVRVQIAGAKLRATAAPLDGDERDSVWARHVAAWPRWGVYQARTSRRIPVVELRLG
ncbi:MAG: nitroreductase family deazaflavin-dependent oxidoreductase [Polyangiaceae bacterium]|nr:nitroreductase family deazaflavin-dependent oxidoreductase [Polyangiaceae bacterium]